MSMGSNIGAETAAAAILEVIEKQKVANADKPEVLAALAPVEAEARNIKEAAEAGYY